MNRGPSPLRFLLVIGLTVAAGVKFLGWLDLGDRSRPRPTLEGTAMVAADRRAVSSPFEDPNASASSTAWPRRMRFVVSD